MKTNNPDMNNPDMNELPVDDDAGWFSYYHQRATLPPPIGARVIYSWLDGIDLRRLYEVVGYDDTTNPRCVVLRDMDTSETLNKIDFREVAPAIRQHPVTLETLGITQRCGHLIRVRDGKSFVPTYFKTSLKGEGDLVLITTPDEPDTEIDTVPSSRLSMGHFNTLYILSTDVEAVDKAYRQHQLSLIDTHEKRIKDKVKRDQLVAAEWVASMA